MTPPIMSMGSAEGPPTLALTGNRSSCLAPRLVTILIGRISIWALVSKIAEIVAVLQDLVCLVGMVRPSAE